jgi:hypothetical protein
MKVKFIIAASLGILATAFADTYSFSTDNNHFLGFYAADEVATKSVLINLGPSVGISKGITLDLRSSTSALSTTYGTNWFNNSQVYWGLLGYDGAYGEDGNAYVARPTGQPLLETGFINGTALSLDNYYLLLDNVSALVTAHTAGSASLSTVVGSTGNTHGISVVDNSAVSFSGMADANFNIFTTAVYAQALNGLDIQQFSFDGNSLYPTVAT